MKNLFIDYRMRDCEKNKLKEIGYQLIDVPINKNLYPEISSHVDVHVCKINNKIVLENSLYNYINKNVFIRGNSSVFEKYPEDIKYNVCIIGNKAIHNFKYTDTKILDLLKEYGYELIDVKQGYSKCSIAIIDDNSVILSDKGLYNILKNYNIDILFLDYEPDIKLLSEIGYSNKNGFIGGAISRIDDYIFITGDLNKIDKENKIRSFIESKNLKIIDFKNLDVIDYGGIVELEDC